MRAGWFAAPGRTTKRGEIRPLARCGSCGEMIAPGAPMRVLLTGARRCAPCAAILLLGEVPPADLVAVEPVADAPTAQPTVTPAPEREPLLDFRQRQTGEDA
jgi:hypothetical protein